MSGAKPDEQIRTPMQWTGDPGAGFTSGTPWEEINSDYTTVKVAAQTGDQNSLLEHYRKLIKLRNEHPALRVGQTYLVKSDSDKLASYLRASKDETVLVLVNLDNKPVSNYGLNLETGPLSGDYKITSLFDHSTYSPLQANGSGGFDHYAPIAEIPPYSVIILQLYKQ